MREIRGWNPTRIHNELKIEPRQIADAWSAKATDYAYELTTGVSVGETDQTGKMEDIINLFQNRLEVIEKILKNEHGFHTFGDIREVRYGTEPALPAYIPFGLHRCMARQTQNVPCLQA